MTTNIISHVPFRLRAESLALSVAAIWDVARVEWDLSSVFIAEGPASCVCGHPISECCLIVNHLSGNEVVVGNVCVQQFLDLDSEGIFRGLRRISADVGAALSTATIEHAYREGWLNSWEVKFYHDTRGIGKLSARQRAKRVQINQKVLAHYLPREVAGA